MIQVLQALLIICFPALCMVGVKRSRILAWLSPVILCYLFGILLTNVFFFPVDKSLSNIFTQISVALAIPLLLFSTDFVRWMRLAKRTVLSFGLAVISVLICSSIASYWFAGRTDESAKIAGMLVGVYTGGTPNMSAIGLALNIREETFFLLNSADVIMGAVYLMFLMTLAQRLLLLILPPFQTDGSTPQPDSMTDRPPLSFRTGIKPLALAFALAIGIVLASAGLSWILSGGLSITVLVLAITSLGILGSFNRRIRNIQGTYETGDYLLLIFCVAIGTLADIREIMISSSVIFIFCGAVMFGSILLHLLLATILRIDADTAIITSTAAIYGPAFVGPIAGVLKNREIVVSGLTTGLVGLAIGNYLGIGLAYLLK